MVINKIDQLAIAFGVEVRKGSIRYVDGRLWHSMAIGNDKLILCSSNKMSYCSLKKLLNLNIL
jgi:hypothetical protein